MELCSLASTDANPGTVSAVAHTFGVEWPLLLAQIINFCLVAYLLYRFAIKPVLKTIDERQKIISEGLQYAEEMKVQLTETEKKRMRVLEEARTEAREWLEKIKQENIEHFQRQRKQAEEQAEVVLCQAHKRIEQEREKMVKEVREEVATLVVTTTEQVLRKHLNAAERKSFNQHVVADLVASGSRNEASS
jgi:F-type H+-transporting ATPase subunit b